MRQLKKLSLAKLPTPLDFMPNLTKKLGQGNLYIKRDDLTDTGLSGNKIRKLEYLVADAIAQKCDILLTYGGEQTNHGRLTIAASLRARMKAILVLQGKEPDYYSGNLALDKLMGADIFFTEDNLQEFGAKLIKNYEKKGHKIYEIPIGGSNALGAYGYFKMVEELMAQLKQQNIAPKYLVTACGSLGTFAGLWAGAKYFNAPFQVIPIGVNPETSYREEQAAKLINEMSKKYDFGIRCHASELKIHFGRGDISYSGLAYNRPDERTQKAIKLLAQTEAIFVDPCYSGKSFHGFVDQVQHVFEGEDVIFLHTGGIPALWTKEHLDDMQKLFI